MIEGTRSYKGRTAKIETSTTDATKVNSEPSNATNLERRELFQQIVPAAGRGLVKLLRESNLLKSELSQIWKKS